MFVVVDSIGRRLCQDGCWRYFANWGTYKECVKEYRVRGWADRKARRFKARVVEILPGQTMDAAGNVLSGDY